VNVRALENLWDQSRTGHLNVPAGAQSAPSILTQIGSINASSTGALETLGDRAWCQLIWANQCEPGNKPVPSAIARAPYPFTGAPPAQRVLDRDQLLLRADQSRLVPKAAIEYVHSPRRKAFQELPRRVSIRLMVTAPSVRACPDFWSGGRRSGHYWIRRNDFRSCPRLRQGSVDNLLAQKFAATSTVSPRPRNHTCRATAKSRYGAEAGRPGASGFAQL